MKSRVVRLFTEQVEEAMAEIFEGVEESIAEIVEIVKEKVQKIPFYAGIMRKNILCPVVIMPEIRVRKIQNRRGKYGLEVLASDGSV